MVAFPVVACVLVASTTVAFTFPTRLISQPCCGAAATPKQFLSISEILQGKPHLGEYALNAPLRGRIIKKRRYGQRFFFVLRDADGMTIQATATKSNTTSFDQTWESLRSLPEGSIAIVRGFVRPCTVTSRLVSEKRFEIVMDRVRGIAIPRSGEVGSISARVAGKVPWIRFRDSVEGGILKLRSVVCEAFRQSLKKAGFVEITSPKLTSGTAEGGASVFTVETRRGVKTLAQSPQFFKEMAIGAGLGSVFEIGPCFRAESFHSRVHLQEYTGIDIEMEILTDIEGRDESSIRLAGLISKVHTHLMNALSAIEGSDYTKALRQVATVPERSLILPTSPVTISYLDAVAVANSDNSIEINSAGWKKVFRYVMERHGTDLYYVTEFPASIRPFYSKRLGNRSGMCNSFDVFLRGIEIGSGSERWNTADDVLAEMRRRNMSATHLRAAGLQEYVKAFHGGMPPHGGVGLGLERILMAAGLGLRHIKDACFCVA
eukprot:GHVU01061082.1.p1 GENE.GHVU01061082.1~~GHVU01061082.1.p1  ORF type:complete len:490 (+),score=23.47 GHVU01061082.1:217-1686(+)